MRLEDAPDSQKCSFISCAGNALEALGRVEEARSLYQRGARIEASRYSGSGLQPSFQFEARVLAIESTIRQRKQQQWDLRQATPPKFEPELAYTCKRSFPEAAMVSYFRSKGEPLSTDATPFEAVSRCGFAMAEFAQQAAASRADGVSAEDLCDETMLSMEYLEVMSRFPGMMERSDVLVMALGLPHLQAMTAGQTMCISIKDLCTTGLLIDRLSELMIVLTERIEGTDSSEAPELMQWLQAEEVPVELLWELAIKIRLQGTEVAKFVERDGINFMLEYLRAEHFAGGWKAVLTYRKRGMIPHPVGYDELTEEMEWTGEPGCVEFMMLAVSDAEMALSVLLELCGYHTGCEALIEHPRALQEILSVPLVEIFEASIAAFIHAACSANTDLLGRLVSKMGLLHQVATDLIGRCMAGLDVRSDLEPCLRKFLGEVAAVQVMYCAMMNMCQTAGLEELNYIDLEGTRAMLSSLRPDTFLATQCVTAPTASASASADADATATGVGVGSPGSVTASEEVCSPGSPGSQIDERQQGGSNSSSTVAHSSDAPSSDSTMEEDKEEDEEGAAEAEEEEDEEAADEAEEEESSALPIDLMADNLKLMLDMDGESEEAAAMEAHGEAAAAAAAAAEEPQEPHQELLLQCLQCEQPGQGTPVVEEDEAARWHDAVRFRQPPNGALHFQLCRHYTGGSDSCQYGDSCSFAHGDEELAIWNSLQAQSPDAAEASPVEDGAVVRGGRRPGAYVLCKHFIAAAGDCGQGDECSFAHSVKELRAWNALTLLPPPPPLEASSSASSSFTSASSLSGEAAPYLVGSTYSGDALILDASTPLRPPPSQVMSVRKENDVYSLGTFYIVLQK